MTRFIRFLLTATAALVLAANTPLVSASTFGDTAVHLVPTFQSVGIYWAPGGNVGNVQVKFRPVTNPASAFRDGQALTFDNRPSTVSYGQEYRGSLVELQPGTAYEIQLIPSGATAPAVPQVTTWDTRPDNVADDPATQTIPGGTSNFTIAAGGSAATGYKVFDGWNGTANNEISVGTAVNNCININASFVVVRRITCRGGLRSGIQIADNVTNVVIEDVEVTDFEQAALNVVGWGNRGENDEGAIKLGTTGGAAQGNNSKIVIQKSKLHTPHWGANPWSISNPAGPYGIFVEQGRGQNVFRWNEIYSTGTDHQWYQDCIGGTPNFSTQGAPGSDSDIYGNALRNCYDDGIEAEGGGRNVRIWGNYLDHIGIVMGNASISIGPFYLWRNVSGQLANIKCPACTETSEDRGPFIKGGSGDATLNGGAAFYYHNTILQPPGVNFPKGAGFGIADAGGSNPLFNFVSRNNIWHIHRITDNPGEPDFFSITADCNSTTQPCSADFDLYNGRVFSGGDNAEANSVAMGWGVAPIPPGGNTGGTTGLASAVPTYATSNSSYPAASAIPTLENGWVGDFRLAASSLGTTNVPLLPNFNDLDSVRNLGAQAPGAATMNFGRAATGTVPTASFTWSQTPATQTVTFNASGSSDGSSPITSLHLQFGDGTDVTWSDKTQPQPHTYTASGPFTATLTATNSFGTSAPASQQVQLTGGGEVLPGTPAAGNLGFSVPTFHSMSLYYNPASAPANCTTTVGTGCKIWMRYRRADEPNTAWREGYPLWFDPRITGTALPYTVGTQQYRARGSAVHLQPGVKYFFEFGSGASFAGATWLHNVAGTTWSETFPENPTKVTIASQTGVYIIPATGGGTSSAYKVYDGWNGTSKNVVNGGGANGESDLGSDLSKAIVVKANFVIVRRVRATGAASAGIFIAPNVTDVVIEDSQVDDWSWRPGVDHATTNPEPNPNSWGTWGINEAGGIHLGGNNSRIVLQRNIIKEPHFGAFPWDTGTACGANNHPAGPMGISIQQAGQQNVIRYNEITGHPTNRNKWYQDGIGGGNNFSTQGVPGADGDIYQNIIMHVFDDAIEAEGGGRNVRIWGNYVTDTKSAIATTTVHFGPTYAWRNVSNRLRLCYQSVGDPGDGGGSGFKYGGTQQGFGRGARYIFHNTMLQELPLPPANAFNMVGIEAITNGDGSVKWTTSRNNILHVKRNSDMSVSPGDNAEGSDFQRDVYNGRLNNLTAPNNANVPIEPASTTPPAIYKFNNDGTSPEFFYQAGNGPSSVPALGGNGTGSYQLETGSKGLDVGEAVPNFSDGFTGTAPDAGAHESGTPLMKFGISAGQ